MGENACKGSGNDLEVKGWKKKGSVKLIYLSHGPGSFLSSYTSFLSLCKVLFVFAEGCRAHLSLGCIMLCTFHE